MSENARQRSGRPGERRSTGRTKRDKIIKANPFREHFTVADLKNWADGKMSEPGAHIGIELVAANAK